MLYIVFLSILYDRTHPSISIDISTGSPRGGALARASFEATSSALAGEAIWLCRRAYSLWRAFFFAFISISALTLFCFTPSEWRGAAPMLDRVRGAGLRPGPRAAVPDPEAAAAVAVADAGAVVVVVAAR